MNKFNDNDIREALRRSEAKRQPAEVPGDFLSNVLDAIDDEADAEHKTIKLWRWVAAAACVAVVAGIGSAILFTGNTSSKPDTNMIAENTETVSTEAPQPVVEETKQAVAKVDAQPVRKSTKKQRTTVTKLVELIPTAEGEGRDMASAEPATEAEFSFDQDPLVAMAEHVQNIRSRGKRLQQAIEDKLNN